MGVEKPEVAVCVVTHNSGDDVVRCIESVAGQTHRPLNLTVVDCASTDRSLDLALTTLASCDLPHRAIGLGTNAGFAGGMNRAIAETAAPFVLILNPDCEIDSRFVTCLLRCVDNYGHLEVAAVTGRLNRLTDPQDPPILDACGMYMTLTWRHLDRGSNRIDCGQFSSTERIFGGTGAATLFRREALEDVKLGDDIFASEFHSYREDAELCFRLRERGWEILYEPTAVARHRRANVPARRRAMDPAINRHSLKNRYLLRAYHQDGSNFLLTLVPTLFRDLAALVYVMIFERSSLSAYTWLWAHRRDIFDRRRALFDRRTCSRWSINRWFLYRRRSL